MATVEGLDAKLDMLIKGLDEFKADIKDKFKCIDSDINGNGKPGLKQRVHDLEEAQKEDDTEIAAIKKTENGWNKMFDFISSPKGIATIIVIITTLLGSGGAVALNKLNALSDTIAKVEKTVEKVEKVNAEVAP